MQAMSLCIASLKHAQIIKYTSHLLAKPLGNWPACSSTRRPAKPRKELASVPANQGMPVNRVMLLIQAFLREVIKVDAGIDPTPGC